MSRFASHQESIFSDLNNLKVVTTTSDQYATSFGFTEQEVFQALDDMGLGREKEDVKRWYDGFTFGRQQNSSRRDLSRDTSESMDSHSKVKSA